MKLFEPGKIGSLSVKNRIVMAPMSIALSLPLEEGGLSPRGIDFYVARARGGTGLIITTFMRPNRRFESSKSEPVINNPICVNWLNELAEAVHDYGTKICVQLSPGLGRIQPPNPALPHGGLIAPSPLPSFWNPGITARELTTAEVDMLIKDYEYSASIISAAGIDAIEIHAHQGYLTDQFVTALWNKRTDKYGGDLDGRLTFPLELVKAVRRGAGEDFPLSYRYGLTHFLDGGREIEEGLEIARRMEAAGVNVLHIDGGCYETDNRVQPPTTQPPGCLVELAEMTKKVVKIPVITVGRLGYPDLAERVLQEGKADFIALGRPLLADPDWPNKVKEGRPEDIIPCLGCHEGCLRRTAVNKHISCAVNPATGMEREFALKPAERPKTVLVIGGGPGGMEAARVARLRGHEVTLWEKGSALGGNLIPASVPEFKQDYRLLIDYLSTQLKKLGVTVKLGQEGTAEQVLKIKPEVVFIATGATPAIKASKCTKCGICDTRRFKPTVCYIYQISDIKEAIEKGKAITAVDALLGRKEVGYSVVIIGGGLVGCETALYLSQKGKRVTVVARHAAMADMHWINAQDLQELLDKANVKILTYTNVSEITNEGIVIVDKQGNKDILRADTVVLAVRLEPDRKLVEALQDKLTEVYAIGDCVEPRIVLNAIGEGFRTARLI